jgi:nitrite reductase/ring-hydroxylating ferredoxin subunit
MALVKVATVAQVPKNSLVKVLAEGKHVLLANVGGEIYAMDAVCTHEAGPLEEGILDGTTLTCSWHEGRYDVRTGLADPETDWVFDTKAWKVVVEGNDVLVDL